MRHLGKPHARHVVRAGTHGVTAYPLPQRIEPPQRAGETARRTVRPQLGERGESEILDQRDELGRQRRICLLYTSDAADE